MLASVIGLRANATAIAGAELEALGVLGREEQREERVVAGLGRPARRRSPTLLELPGRRADSAMPTLADRRSHRRPSWPRTVDRVHPSGLRHAERPARAGRRPVSHARGRPRTAVRVGVPPRGTLDRMGVALPVAVAELDLGVQELPARVPVLLPRPAARAAVGARRARARSCTGRSSCSCCRPPADRTLDAALADLDRARAELADRPRVRRARARRARSGRVPRRRRGARAPVLRARGPHHRAPDRARAQARGASSATCASARHHRPARARRRRRARHHRLQDRLGAARAVRAQEPRAACTCTRCCASRCSGERPVRVQLLYLSKPEAIIAEPSEQSVTGVAAQDQALWSAIERACARDDFRPAPGPLCDFCTFKAYCPAFGGDPAQAAELRGPGTVIEPPLPLRRLSPPGASVLRHGTGASPMSASASPRRSSPAVRRSTTTRSTMRVDADPNGTPRRSTACFYRLSSAADHSLLWFALGVGAGRAHAATSRFALRFGAAMGIESALTNGPIKSLFRRVRPRSTSRRRPAPLRHAPADHVVVPVGPRDRGVHGRGPARERATRDAALVRARRARRGQPRLRADAPRVRRHRRRGARARARPGARRSSRGSRGNRIVGSEAGRGNRRDRSKR